jgi:gamma-glutamylcyclotransferase (GGCT)/AIG2-like uncharacterized protein YtfP
MSPIDFSLASLPMESVYQIVLLYNEKKEKDFLESKIADEILSLFLQEELIEYALKSSNRKTKSAFVNRLLGSPCQKLFTYGSLMPGKQNHFKLDKFKGEWEKGFTLGSKIKNGWGSDLGFDSLRWNPLGHKIEGYLLKSPILANSWQLLDDFEGNDYKRSLLPIFLGYGIELAFGYVAKVTKNDC